ncbi:unnamed protein product [Closterium sp. Naga37s-1]|nr:unnamed protein product [Closterium sp. Naga37s-1]
MCSLREQLQRKESWVYVNVYHHPLPSATTTSSSSSFRGGKPPSQIRVDSLYAFSPILDRWFRLSQGTSPRSSRRIKTVAVKHKQYIFGDGLVIRDAVTGACTRGPQLPSDAFLNMQLAASDSHVVLVSTTPQVIFGNSDSFGDVVAHVLAVDEAGMPHGDWKRLPPRRWKGVISLLAHEGGLWHLIGREAQGLQDGGVRRYGGLGGRRGGGERRYRWDRHIASFDPCTLQWIETEEEEDDEEEEEDGEGYDMLREVEIRAAFLDGYTRVSSPGEVDCGEGPGGCHKKLLLQAAAACEALRRSRDSLRQSLLDLQGKGLQVEMRRLLTPGRLAIDDRGREPGGGKEGKQNAKCVSRRWKAALEDEHLYKLREQLGCKESWVYVNVYHHPPPSATTTSSSDFSFFLSPSQIRVDSLYAFSPVFNKWFRLSKTTSPRSTRRVGTVAVKHKQYIFGSDLVIRDAVTGACTRGPQLPADGYFNIQQLAASDSHVVLVSTLPLEMFEAPDILKGVAVNVLAVDEAGMPDGEWQRLSAPRWTSLIALLAHEEGLWHLIGREGWDWEEEEEEEEVEGGRGRGGEMMRYTCDRQMASFDPYRLQWIDADEEEEDVYYPLL